MKLELAGLSPEIWPGFCMRLWVRQWPGLRSSPRFVHWLQWLCLGTWRSLVSIHMASPCSNLRVTVFLLWWPTGPQPVFHKKAADALGTWPWMSTAWLPPLSMHCGGGVRKASDSPGKGLDSISCEGLKESVGTSQPQHSPQGQFSCPLPSHSSSRLSFSLILVQNLIIVLSIPNGQRLAVLPHIPSQ